MNESENEVIHYEKENFIEEMRNLIKQIPKNVVLVLNVPRYMEVNAAIKRISSFVMSICPDAKFKAEYDPFVGTSIIFTIIVNELSISETKVFADTIAIANTMSVTPVNGGSIELGFTFNNVKFPAPPITNNT